MKRAYAASKYAKPYEQYCRELYQEQAEEIFRKAEESYKDLVKNDMPDLGENMMAANMLDWFTIVSFYEASGHKLDGEALLTIKHRAVDRMQKEQANGWTVERWRSTRRTQTLAAGGEKCDFCMRRKT